MEKIRSNNFDILRILASTGVIILHLNSYSVGGIMDNARFSSFNSVLAYFGEAFCICAVNIFLLISGYFLVERESIRITKIFKLLLEVSILGGGAYVAKMILGKNKISVLELFIHVYCKI